MQRPDGSTSDGRIPTGANAKRGKICRHCGDAVKIDEWYPVASRTAPDGSVEIYPFCGDDCREAWTAGRDARDDATVTD